MKEYIEREAASAKEGRVMDGCIYRTKDGECDFYAEGGKYHAFCVGDAHCDGRKQSNADRIRQMSDEELAHFLKRFSDCAICPAFSTKCKSINFDNCEDAWIEWLKQEVESDEPIHP